MADLTRIFDIQGFTGGESDDIYRGPKDSFYSGENIEVRKNLSGIQLASILEDTGWSISGDIIFMINLKKFGLTGEVVCTDTGKIYLDGVLKTTLNTGTTTYNRVIGIDIAVVSGTTYIYYITQTSFGTGKIHRSTSNLGTFNVSYREYITYGTTITTAPCFTLKLGNGFLFTKGGKIFSLDNVEVVDEIFSIPEDETITGITEFQNNYRIYATVGNNGVQYTWDGYNILPDYRQVWENQPILGVVNDGAYDYAILGFNENYSDLYLISGTQKQELRVNLETSIYSRVLSGYLSIREGIVYISGGKTGESTNYGIYTYGNYYPGTPKSLVQSFSLSTNKFTFHSHSNALSYFANSDNKVYKINHNNPPTFATSGYVISQVYEGNQWEEKTFIKMEVAFKLETGTYFKIYVRKDIGDTWKNLKTVDNATYGTKRKVRIFKNEFSNLTGNFNSLQIKLELFGSSDKTPIIKRVTSFLQVTE